MIIQHFDNKSERNAVLQQVGPQQSIPKPGVTRGQIQRYHARRKAVETATRFRYPDGSTAQQMVDNAFEQGLTTVKRGRFGYTLTDPATGDALRFKHKPERDYIDTLLGHGSLSRR